MTKEVETINDCLVGSRGAGIVMFNPPVRGEFMDREKALRLAAWIVVMADDDNGFEAVRKAILAT